MSDSKFEFTEMHLHDNALINADYKRILFRLTGCVNRDRFKGLDAGKCLFLGAIGAQRGIDEWSVTYRFCRSRHENFPVADFGNLGIGT